MWRPIDTAPKDEMAVLLYIPEERPAHEGSSPVCYWSAYNATGGGGYIGGDGWVVCFSGEDLFLHFSTAPTHWQPLPEPPQ